MIDVEGTDEKKNRDQDDRDLNLDTKMDLEAENWRMNLEKKTFSPENDKNRDHKEDYEY